MQHLQASNIAIALCYQLQPYCSKINIAGSIRRKKAEVGDIEIVCTPNKIKVGQVSLFGGSTEKVSCKEFHDVVTTFGVIELGNPDGRQMKILLPQGIKLDLFMPQEPDYFRIYAIRTGSSLFSSMVLASSWKRNGWCGTDQGLRKIIDCIQVGDNKWKVLNTAGQRPPFWASEEEFFEWLGVKYLHPCLRDIQSTSATYQKRNLLNPNQ
ncbi:MAG: hypothetical protein H7336_09865 [Bacteriovorax sp.]|nr:hypothetical protein [Bacteriovorax sp.]